MPVDVIDPGGQPLTGPDARQAAHEMAERLGRTYPRQQHNRPGAPRVGVEPLPAQAEQDRRDAAALDAMAAPSVVIVGRPTVSIDDGAGYGLDAVPVPPDSPRAQLDREDRGWRGT